MQAERFLHPGEYYFGRQPLSLYTILGSCVSLVLWHPQQRSGGMCHIKLPHRQVHSHCALDGAYANHVEPIIAQFLRRVGHDAKAYRCHLYGGGQMFPTTGPHCAEIGVANIEAARAVASSLGLQVQGQSVGGPIYRKLHFDMRTGEVHLTESRLMPKVCRDHPKRGCTAACLEPC